MSWSSAAATRRPAAAHRGGRTGHGRSRGRSARSEVALEDGDLGPQRGDGGGRSAGSDALDRVMAVGDLLTEDPRDVVAREDEALVIDEAPVGLVIASRRRAVPRRWRRRPGPCAARSRSSRSRARIASRRSLPHPVEHVGHGVHGATVPTARSSVWPSIRRRDPSRKPDDPALERIPPRSWGGGGPVSRSSWRRACRRRPRSSGR